MRTLITGMIATVLALAILPTPAFSTNPTAGDFVYIPLGSDGKVTVVYAVGSLANGTFGLLAQIIDTNR